MALQVISPTYAPNRQPFHAPKEKEDWMDKLIKGLTIAEKATGVAVNVEDFMGKRGERIEAEGDRQAMTDASKGVKSDALDRYTTKSGGRATPLSQMLQPTKDEAKRQAQGLPPTQQEITATPSKLLEVTVGKDKAAQIDGAQAQTASALGAGILNPNQGQFDTELLDLFKTFYTDPQQFSGSQYDQSIMDKLDLTIGSKGEVLLTGLPEGVRNVGQLKQFKPNQLVGETDMLVQQGDELFVIKDFLPLVDMSIKKQEAQAKLLKNTAAGKGKSKSDFENYNKVLTEVAEDQRKIINDPLVQSLGRYGESLDFVLNNTNNTGFGHVGMIFKMQPFFDERGSVKETEINMLSHASTVGSPLSSNAQAMLNKIRDKVATSLNITQDQLDKMTQGQLVQALESLKKETGFLDAKDVNQMRLVAINMYEDKQKLVDQHINALNSVNRPAHLAKLRNLDPNISENQLGYVIDSLLRNIKIPGYKTKEELKKIKEAYKVDSVSEVETKVKQQIDKVANAQPTSTQSLPVNQADVDKLTKLKEEQARRKMGKR